MQGVLLRPQAPNRTKPPRELAHKHSTWFASTLSLILIMILILISVCIDSFWGGLILGSLARPPNETQIHFWGIARPPEGDFVWGGLCRASKRDFLWGPCTAPKANLLWGALVLGRVARPQNGTQIHFGGIARPPKETLFGGAVQGPQTRLIEGALHGRQSELILRSARFG